ncbi:MAG: DegT/DnrJ/EryC1/StrS family aminotransferase [Alphaproteobacteria bacterium]|nr:DegT/DnrJ/EryC1/StrS family aminotransferase [Alphaproteobacteria bacterium]
MNERIEFIDLNAQRNRIAGRIESAIMRVLEHGQFIMGPEVKQFEKELAAYAGVQHAVTCANGTDALVLALMALGIGPGDAVLVPSFTFVATAEAPVLVGATPVLVDVDPQTFNIDPGSLERSIAFARKFSLKPRAIIPVDLFGLPADYAAIAALAEREGMTILSDAAQSFGGMQHGKRVGGLAPITTTSFFPAKPLGCYGDGGAILTDDDALAEILRSLRVHGKGRDKYDNVRIGQNSRLDTLQAAILIEKLAILEDEMARRQIVAERYVRKLAGVVETQAIPSGHQSAWAQYTIKHPDRDRLAKSLKESGIPTAIYYPTPLHLQTAYRNFPADPAGLRVCEKLSAEVLSLPMHPYLDEMVQDRIVAAIRSSV